MLGYLPADIICSEKRTIFQEHSLRKTGSYEEQIMSNIQTYFCPNRRLLCLCNAQNRVRGQTLLNGLCSTSCVTGCCTHVGKATFFALGNFNAFWGKKDNELPSKRVCKLNQTKMLQCVNFLNTNMSHSRPFYSRVLSYQVMNASEAGGDLALIQSYLLFLI